MADSEIVALGDFGTVAVSDEEKMRLLEEAKRKVREHKDKTGVDLEEKAKGLEQPTDELN